jgi:hypothetical protein
MPLHWRQAREMGELHHDRMREANAAFEYCFDKANVLRLNSMESIHQHYSLFQPSAAQWSLCVPHSGHYVDRTVVTMCTAQWSLHVPHSGHYVYRTVVTTRTASLTFAILRSAHTVYLCVLCGSVNKQRLFLYTALIDWFIFTRYL